MIKRILVGLGGTPFTPTAIRYAVEMAQVQQAEVLGMTVTDRRRLGALTKAMCFSTWNLAGRAFSIEHLAALDAEEEPEEEQTHWAG